MRRRLFQRCTRGGNWERGRVTAAERDTELAERASANLARWNQVRVTAADGWSFDFDEADWLLVNAGATSSDGVMASQG